jgi:hypothetical protein
MIALAPTRRKQSGHYKEHLHKGLL